MRTVEEDQAPPAAPAPQAASGGEPTWEETRVVIERFDNAVLYGGLVARLVIYGLLVWLAYSSPLWMSFLTGVFIADLGLRAILALLDAFAGHYASWLELGLFVAVGYFWIGAGGTLLPSEMESRGVTMLGFLAVFSIRGSYTAWRRLHPE